jgi:ribosomal protein S18 acetylase RimI-like enzyme
MYSFFQSQGVGDALIRYATEEFGADNLWALEKNKRAISFYQNHGFQVTGRKRLEENTTEYLVLDRSRRRNAFSFLNEKINSI